MSLYRKLGPFIVVGALTVQTLSVLHLAEYPNERHEHGGTLCSIYLCSEQVESGIHTTHIDSLEYSPFRLDASRPAHAWATSEDYDVAPSRAPPVFS